MMNKNDFIWGIVKERGYIYSVPTKELILVESDIVKKFEEGETDKFARMVRDNFGEKPNRVSRPLRRFEECKRIERLQFILTNRCNLKCNYCYANEGTYNKVNTGSITKEIVDTVISCLKNNDIEVSNIVFFGGEPLLEYRMISYICEQMDLIIKNKVNYSMVTNMTYLTDEAIATIKQYNISLTVSIDGPKVVHDRQRRYKDGGGTFDIICKNIKKLEGNGVELSAIEATYTDEHTRRGISKDEVHDFLQERFSCEFIMVEDVIKDGNQTKMDIDAKPINFASPKVEDLRILDGLLGPDNSTPYCNAGFMEICVDIDGQVYPCHLYVSFPAYSMGTIENILNKEDNSVEIRKKIENVIAGKCNSCSARRTCKYCHAQLQLYHKDDKFKNCDTIIALNQLWLEQFIGYNL